MSGVVATVAAVVPFADADFDNDYIVLVVAVQITVFIVGLAVAFFVGFYIVLLKDADVPTVFYADVQYSSYNLWIYHHMTFVYVDYDFYVLFLPFLNLMV